MVKCYLTGVNLTKEDAYLLDLGPAYRALLELRQRLAALERLINQLGPHEEVQVYDPKTAKTITAKHRRLVSASVAATLAAVSPDEPLFIRMAEWRARKMDATRKAVCPDSPVFVEASSRPLPAEGPGGIGVLENGATHS